MNFPRLLLIVFLALALSSSPCWAGSNDFVDEEGNPIIIPTPQTSISLEKPGFKKTEAALHDPAIASRKLVQGLETTRVLTLTVPHPVPKTKAKDAKFPIKGIYLVDKDGIVVGYRSFSITDSEVVYKTKINGVINFLDVYVECREHGTWHKKVRLT